MASTRKRFYPEEEKRMWQWIYQNLKKGNKDAYVPCGFQIWNQYIENYDIKDRTADSFATRFRKIMKPSIVSSQLKPSEIFYIIQTMKWNVTPAQQLVLKKMLADEGASVNGDISVVKKEENIVNAPVPLKEVSKVVESAALDTVNGATTSKTIIPKCEVIESKESMNPPSARRSRRCNNQVPNYNEKFLSRRSYAPPAAPSSPAPVNTSTTEKLLNKEIKVEENDEGPSTKKSKKRPSSSDDVHEPAAKKRTVSDTTPDTPKSIFVSVKEENDMDLSNENTVAEKNMTESAKDFISTPSEALPINAGGWDSMDDESNKGSKSFTVNSIVEKECITPFVEITTRNFVVCNDEEENVSNLVKENIVSKESILAPSETPIIAEGYESMNVETNSGDNIIADNSIVDKENVQPNVEITSKNIVVNNVKQENVTDFVKNYTDAKESFSAPSETPINDGGCESMETESSLIDKIIVDKENAKPNVEITPKRIFVNNEKQVADIVKENTNEKESISTPSKIPTDVEGSELMDAESNSVENSIADKENIQPYVKTRKSIFVNNEEQENVADLVKENIVEKESISTPSKIPTDVEGSELMDDDSNSDNDIITDNTVVTETPKSSFSSKETVKESDTSKSNLNSIKKEPLEVVPITSKPDVLTVTVSTKYSENEKTTPVKIIVPSATTSNQNTPSILTPKSILSSGQRKARDDGSAMRVRFQSPEKSSTEINLTPKRIFSTPNTTTSSSGLEFSEIDTELLQLLWHKVHGTEVHDLSNADLIAMKKISLFKDLHMRVNNVLTFFRGRKPTFK
uniref:Uncharacterized protein n=1 Tax=Panagrolaimus superbus TaxID=310955 RepID=A0A914YRI5_9BILA